MKSIVTELTPKQQLFCDEYLKDMNASAAALRAGYSAGTALNGQLMQLPKVKHYLQQRTAQVVQKVRVSHEQVLAELAKIAFSNMGDYFTDDGGLKPMHEIGNDAKAALWSLSVSDAGSGAVAGRVVGDNTNNGQNSDNTNNGHNRNNTNNGHNRQEYGGRVVKFRMYNKLSALKEIAKHIGFYKPEDIKPDKEQILVTREDLTDDDLFDDEEMQELREQLQEERQELSGDDLKQKQASRSKNQDEQVEEEQDEYDPDAIPLDEDGNVLCDGAGIPYGPLPPVVVAAVVEQPAVIEPVRRSAFVIKVTAFPTNHTEFDAALKGYFVREGDLKGMSLKDKGDLLGRLKVNGVDLAGVHNPVGLR